MNVLVKSARPILMNIPFVIGIILLVALFRTIIPSQIYLTLFSGGPLDTFIGAVVGSISFGNPVVSYVIGGELEKLGISLLAITAFIVAWVTVGIVQLPAEAAMLGKKFAILRNLFSFLFSVIAAVIIVILVSVL